MQIILLNEIINLGKLGDLINIKSGYARNFLIPKGKAIIATKANINYFNFKKKIIYNKINKLKILSKLRINKIKNLNNVIIEAKSDNKGKLFGSISITDIIKKFKIYKINMSKNEIKLPNGNLKKIGLHEINIYIYKILINIYIKIINKK